MGHTVQTAGDAIQEAAAQFEMGHKVATHLVLFVCGQKLDGFSINAVIGCIESQEALAHIQQNGFTANIQDRLLELHQGPIETNEGRKFRVASIERANQELSMFGLVLNKMGHRRADDSDGIVVPVPCTTVGISVCTTVARHDITMTDLRLDP